MAVRGERQPDNGPTCAIGGVTAERRRGALERMVFCPVRPSARVHYDSSWNVILAADWFEFVKSMNSWPVIPK